MSATLPDNSLIAALLCGREKILVQVHAQGIVEYIGCDHQPAKGCERDDLLRFQVFGQRSVKRVRNLIGITCQLSAILDYRSVAVIQPEIVRVFARLGEPAAEERGANQAIGLTGNRV